MGHDGRLEERVIEAVEAAGMDGDVIIMSLKQQSIQNLRELRPAWRVGLLAATALGDLTRLDVDFLAVHQRLGSAGFIERVHRAGKLVYVRTVNDPVGMSRFASLGVDGLITDEPARARQVLAERALLNPAERLLLDAGLWLGMTFEELPALPPSL